MFNRHMKLQEGNNTRDVTQQWEITALQSLWVWPFNINKLEHLTGATFRNRGWLVAAYSLNLVQP